MQNNKPLIDQGWDRMSNILDKELPQKKERSAFVWWLTSLSVLLLFYGVWKFNQTDSLATSNAELSIISSHKNITNGKPFDHVTHDDLNIASEDADMSTEAIPALTLENELTMTEVLTVNKDEEQVKIEQSNFEVNSHAQLITNESSVEELEEIDRRNKKTIMVAPQPAMKVHDEINLQNFSIVELDHSDYMTKQRGFSIDKKIPSIALSSLYTNDVELDMPGIDETKIVNSPKFQFCASLMGFGTYMTNFKSVGVGLGLITEWRHSHSRVGVMTGFQYARFNLSSSSSRDYINADDEELGINKANKYELVEGGVDNIQYFSLPTIMTYKLRRWKLGIGVEHRFLYKTSDITRYELGRYNTSQINGRIGFNSYLIDGVIQASYYAGNRSIFSVSYHRDFKGILANADTGQLNSLNRINIGYQFLIFQK